MGLLIAKLRRRRALLILGALVAVSIWLSTTITGPHFTTVGANPFVSIDAESLHSGDARFFSYRDSAGDRIRFLLARDSTGQIKGAFDACRSCSRYGVGYTCSGGSLVCGYCGNRYKLEAMETGRASCVPVKLPMQVNGNTVTIRPADLQRERGLF